MKRAAPCRLSCAVIPGETRRKLVFVNRYFHPDQSATSRLLSDLAFRLAGMGIDVAVVTSRQLYDRPRAHLLPLERIAGVTIHRVRTAVRGRSRLAGRAVDYLSFHLAAALKLSSLLRRGDVVVAKTDPPLLSIGVSLLAHWRGAQLVNWLQDIFPEVAAALGVALPRRIDAVLRRARDRSLARARMNVVLGERMRAYLLGRGVPPPRIRCIPNWADTAQIEPLPRDRSRTRADLGLQGRFVVAYSGNQGRAHEFDTLLGAVRLLREDERFAFLMVGDGARAQSLRHAVETERLHSVRFLPFQPAECLADALAAADVHLISLIPALEGLIVPSKLYGILAAGRPAIFIGDPEGEIARVLREGECGRSVRTGDSARLAELVRSLCDAPEMCAAMGLKARQLALSCYSSERAAGAWRAMLGEIAPGLVPDQPCPTLTERTSSAALEHRDWRPPSSAVTRASARTD